LTINEERGGEEIKEMEEIPAATLDSFFFLM
jgi:hypothetical protein